MTTNTGAGNGAARTNSDRGANGAATLERDPGKANRNGNKGNGRPDEEEEAGEEIASRTDGFSLFGKGPQTPEAFQESLKSFLIGDEGKAEKKQSTETGETRGEPNAETPGEGEEGEAEGEGEEEQDAAGDGEEGEESGKSKGESQEEEAVSRDWPKSAVAEVTKLRADRREAREAVQQRDDEIGQLRSRLESEELKRPVQPTREHPLSFADSEEKLRRWEENTEWMVQRIDDALDNSLSGQDEEFLRDWAKKNGAWDAENETFETGALKRAKRDGENALRRHVPQQREFLQQRGQFNRVVQNDPVLAPIWKNKASQEYKDAMGVFERVPSIRNYPEATAMAAIYALGLREWRKSMPAAGQEQQAGKQGGTKVPPSRLPAGKRSVTLPGRTVTLPRNTAATEEQRGQALMQKVRSGKATHAEYEEYTKMQLTGKIPSSR
jgi:hypothetical protein